MNENIKNEVKDTKVFYGGLPQDVENTIQNGVKHTDCFGEYEDYEIDTIIQNGVKEIGYKKTPDESFTNHIIQNGVKETIDLEMDDEEVVDYLIQRGVKKTKRSYEGSRKQRTKYTIQNGVKNTVPMGKNEDSIVSNDFGMNQAIENGVKYTISNPTKRTYYVDDAIENGVKDTKPMDEWVNSESIVDKTMQTGVKHTEYGDWEDCDYRLVDIIKNGVKQTCAQIPSIDAVVERVVEEGIKETNMEEHHRLREVVQTLKNGVKETKSVSDDLFELLRSDKITSHEYVDTLTQDYWVASVLERGIKETNWRTVENYPEFEERIIKNGIKEVQPLPAQDGNRDWGLYYKNREDRTKPHTQYVNDVIENGEKI